MSETLSYQPEVQTESAPDNLTPEEQDSLAVGEKLQAEQEGLLAGKYKSAEELEKAYVELQKKLGESKEEDTEQSSAEPEPEDKTQLSEGATLITDASKEYFDNGNKLSPETLAKFASLLSPSFFCNSTYAFSSSSALLYLPVTILPSTPFALSY